MGFFERLHSNQHSRVWQGNIPVEFLYTAGIAGEKFLRALRDSGKILGAVCKNCNITYVPARAFCERCMNEITEYRDVGNRGRINSFTVIKKDARGNPLREPKILGLIEFEGTRGGILHYIEKPKKGGLQIGDSVEAVLEKKQSRKGSITDIKFFRVTG